MKHNVFGDISHGDKTADEWSPAPARTHANRDRLICRGHELFVGFLRHMVQTEPWDEEALIACVDKPWKWQKEFEAFVRDRTS